LQVDRTILATGHPLNRLQGIEKTLDDFAAAVPSTTFIRGDSVADMDLDSIAPSQMVGIIGMSLTFYDLIAELTTGREGHFTTEVDGSLQYHPSGHEPSLFASSRSGMPVPGRGRNQKPYDYEYQPAIFTLGRARAIRQQGDVHFDRVVLPLLESELTLVHAETRLRLEKGVEVAQKLRHLVIEQRSETVTEVVSLASSLGLSSPVPIDLYKLATPFQGRSFTSPESFTSVLQSVLADDYTEAMLGNMDSPLKAALDVIRNTRSVIREFVDFGGLDPDSHRLEFLTRFSSASSLLSAGPPAFRILQLQALIESGVLTIVGPSVIFEPSLADDCIYMSSPKVQNSSIALQVVIDARLPTTDITRDCSELTRSLLNKGIYVPYVNRSKQSVFETGGVDITPSPFHPIRADHSIACHIYVLGIPTEHTRWFMQSGSSRPHKWIDFMIDADAIAIDILEGLAERAQRFMTADTRPSHSLNDINTVAVSVDSK